MGIKAMFASSWQHKGGKQQHCAPGRLLSRTPGIGPSALSRHPSTFGNLRPEPLLRKDSTGLCFAKPWDGGKARQEVEDWEPAQVHLHLLTAGSWSSKIWGPIEAHASPNAPAIISLWWSIKCYHLFGLFSPGSVVCKAECPEPKQYGSCWFFSGLCPGSGRALSQRWPARCRACTTRPSLATNQTTNSKTRPQAPLWTTKIKS